jgi:hypothetical protein
MRYTSTSVLVPNTPYSSGPSLGNLCLDSPKKGSVPLFYIRSATAAKRGVRARFQEYDRGIHLSRNVEEALCNGNTTVSKHLLVQCPIPAAADIPRVRITFVAIEAMFSFMFWTMHSRTKDYGCGQFCPCARLGFEWHGLNSHNPLTESVDGNFNLSAEALEAIADKVAEKNRVYQVDYRADQRVRSPERVRALQRKRNHR